MSQQVWIGTAGNVFDWNAQSHSGWVNITPYIAFGGLKWTRNDIDSADAGRTQDGLMHRGRVGTKDKLELTFRPLKQAEVETVFRALFPEFIAVAFVSPREGNVTKQMYSNNSPATYCMIKPDGTEWWNGISAPLVEK